MMAKNRWKMLAFASGFAVLMTCAWLVSALSVGPSQLSSAAGHLLSVANFGGNFLAQHLQSFFSLDSFLMMSSSAGGEETRRFAGTGWLGFAAIGLAAAFIQGLVYAVLVGAIVRWWARRRAAPGL